MEAAKMTCDVFRGVVGDLRFWVTVENAPMLADEEFSFTF
jgi:hypothetical protein